MPATPDRHRLVAVATALVLTAGAAGAAPGAGAAPVGLAQAARVDWPQFRGPNRDGISPETGLASAWPEAGPRERWRTPLGAGYSGMSVAGGTLYTMFGRDGGEWLAAIDTFDGRRLWEIRVDDLRRDGQGDGPRATPTVDDDRVYALSAGGVLAAVLREDGRSAWTVDLTDRFGARPPTWGYAASPLVEDGLVLVDVGGSSGAGVVALRRDSGAEAWRALDGGAGYSAPITVAIGGLRQTIFFNAAGVTAVAPATGRELWSVPWRTSYDVNAATPIFVPPDGIFVSSGYDVGAALLRVTVQGDRARADEAWRTRDMKNQFSSSVLVDGYLYGFDGTNLTCLDARTGERMWRARGFGHGSLIAADGKLVVLGDRGRLALVAIDPGQYREISAFQVLDTKTWTPPTLADGTLYVRDERQLLALDLRETDGS